VRSTIRASKPEKFAEVFDFADLLKVRDLAFKPFEKSIIYY